jgi:hypothetical protein
MEESAFISYAREDKDFVARLVGHLKHFSIPVWEETFDQFDAGNNWLSHSEQAFASARVVMLVVSTNMLHSSAVQKEINIALNERKAIIPLLYSDNPLPEELLPFRPVSFRPPRAYNTAFGELLTVLEPLRQTVVRDVDMIQQKEHINTNEVIKKLRAVRKKTLQDNQGKILEDSSEMIRRMREERTGYLENIWRNHEESSGRC